MRYFISTPLIVVLAAELSVAVPTYASTPAEIAKAAQLLERDQSAEALSLLEATHNVESANLQELFLLGVAAKESGDLPKSESYFRRAVAADPSAGRIKLELAEVLALQGKLPAAKAELQSVQAMNPPPEVQQNIERFIAQIDAAEANQGVGFAQGQKPKSWNAYVSAGLIYDSNVNASTDADSVTFFGLPFRLSDDAKETEDGAWTIRAGINHRLMLSEQVAWDSSLNGSFTDYFTADDYDNLTFQVSSGPSFALQDKGSISFPLTLSSQSFTDSSEDWYSVSYGIAPSLQYALSENLFLGVGTSLSRKVFIEDRDRDSTLWGVSPSLRFKPFETAGTFSFGVNYARENSGQEIYSNERIGGFVGYEHEFADTGLKASITASYADTQYDGIQAAQTEARHDMAPSISGSLSYALPLSEALPFAANSVVAFNANYTDNRSNLDINDYNRTQVSLTFTKRF